MVINPARSLSQFKGYRDKPKSDRHNFNPNMTQNTS